MAHAVAVPLSSAALLERLGGLMLWLTGFSGAFVLMEPSPYELVALATMALFFLTGLPMRAGQLLLLVLLIVYGVGLTIGVVPVLARDNTFQWTLVSWFMIATAFFYACVLAQDTGRRLDLLLSGYTAVAVIVSILAILAYFQLIPGADELLLYGRAKGTFKDPNVLGPFLVLPALLSIRRALSGGTKNFLTGGAMLALFAVALLLTFSRGAWAHLAFSALLYVVFLFASAEPACDRRRIVLASITGAILVSAAIAALLSTQSVGALFSERASLEQAYDVGHLGRFGRHILGAALALDNPFGIGPLQFVRYFPEDAHNVYLNSFMAGGWIAGISYLLLVALTLFVGFKAVQINTPWRPVMLAVFATFIGIAIEGAIIDTDHWRHFWLLLGTLWGGAIAAQRAARTRIRGARAA
jgi:hypothetical protein